MGWAQIAPAGIDQMSLNAEFQLETTDPFAGLREFFERIQRPAQSDVRPVADAVRAGFAENFRTESSAEGPWAPLRPMTIRQRIARGYPGAHPILVQSGELRTSFTQSGGDHIDRLDQTNSGWELSLGSRHRNAAKMALGDPANRVPARPITPLQQSSVRRVDRAVDEMLEGIARATLRQA